jgi:hypothetical protein
MMMMRSPFQKLLLLHFALVSSAIFIGLVSARVGKEEHRELVQHHRKLRRAQMGQGIFGRYIIVLNANATDRLDDMKGFLTLSGVQVDYEYDSAVIGLAVRGLVRATLLKIILDDDIVEYVEEVSGKSF